MEYDRESLYSVGSTNQDRTTIPPDRLSLNSLGGRSICSIKQNINPRALSKRDLRMMNESRKSLNMNISF